MKILTKLFQKWNKSDKDWDDYPASYADLNLIKIYRNTDFPSYFTVDWMLHDRCTYDCSYCPPANKSGTDSWLNLDKLDEFCDRLEKHVRSIDPSLKMHCLFTGGEPTVWKDFGELVTRLNHRGWALTVNSNGSRSERWWEENAHNFTNIILSYHTESVDDEEFIRKVKIAEKAAITSINIMLNSNPAYFDKAVEFGKRIRNETTYVSATHYKIQHNFGLQEINVPLYTKAQKEIISTLIDVHPDITQTYKREFIQNFYVETDTNEKYRCNGAGLLSDNKANFKDWSCYAGVDGIFVDAKGNIHRGTCRVGLPMGNILEPEEIEWVTQPVRCPLTWCGCVTDILTRKDK